MHFLSLAARNKHGTLLAGTLRCGLCKCGMAYAYSQIRVIGRDPAVVAATVAATRGQAEEATKRALAGERAALKRQRRDDEAEERHLRPIAAVADWRRQRRTWRSSRASDCS